MSELKFSVIVLRDVISKCAFCATVRIIKGIGTVWFEGFIYRLLADKELIEESEYMKLDRIEFECGILTLRCSWFYNE